MLRDENVRLLRVSLVVARSDAEQLASVPLCIGQIAWPYRRHRATRSAVLYLVSDCWSYSTTGQRSLPAYQFMRCGLGFVLR